MASKATNQKTEFNLVDVARRARCSTERLIREAALHYGKQMNIARRRAIAMARQAIERFNDNNKAIAQWILDFIQGGHHLSIVKPAI